MPLLLGVHHFDSHTWQLEIPQRWCPRKHKKIVEIEVGNQIYIIKNPYHENAYELSDNLTDQIYDSIRECDTDICDIAENLGFKADNSFFRRK